MALPKTQTLTPLKAKNPIASVKPIKGAPKLNVNAVKIRKSQRGI